MSSTPFGEHLKRERELRGVSLEEVAAATRISPRFLEAIENEQWDRLPGSAFTRGFIRAIARFLGLDEDSLVAEYALKTKGAVDARAVPTRSDDIPRNWGRIGVTLLIVVLAAVLAYLVYHRYAIRVADRFRHHSTDSRDPSRASVRPTSLAMAVFLGVDGGSH